MYFSRYELYLTHGGAITHLKSLMVYLIEFVLLLLVLAIFVGVVREITKKNKK